MRGSPVVLNELGRLRSYEARERLLVCAVGDGYDAVEHREAVARIRSIIEDQNHWCKPKGRESF